METPTPPFQIGYARVSADGQTLDGQIDELRAAGCAVVYCEQKSGVSRKGRAELAKAIAALPHGGVLVVKALDRLGRGGIRDMAEALTQIEARGAKFRSLREPWADTGTPVGELMTFIVAWFARFERDAILERTAAGRARAKRSGKKLGRPRKLSAVQLAHAVTLYGEGMSYAEIGRVVGADRRTVSRAVSAVAAQEAVDQQSVSLLASGDTIPIS